jgi:flagellar basal body-associated protein FliL
MTNRRNSNSGFAALEGLLILIIIVIIGGTGYFVWHSKAQTDKSLDKAASTKIIDRHQESTSSPDTKNAQDTIADKYLIVKEWGIKIGLDDASKVTYIYSDKNGTIVDGEYESSITKSH